MNSIVLYSITGGFFKGKFIAASNSVLSEKGLESLITMGRLITREDRNGKTIFVSKMVQIVSHERFKNSEDFVHKGFLCLASKEERETLKKLISREWDITDRERLFDLIKEITTNHNLFRLLFEEEYHYPENYEIFKSSLEKSFEP